MKVLAITGARNIGPKRVRDVVEQLDLGPDLELELLTVRPPTRNLPVSRVDAVEPSVVPFRPIVPVSGPGVQDWRGPRKQVARVLRAGRKVSSRVPLPDSMRLSNQLFLALAGATSRELRSRAEKADVIVALDWRAALAAWHLARRVAEPAVAYGAENARQVLERMGRKVLPRSSVEGSGATQKVESTSRREDLTHELEAPPMPEAPREDPALVHRVLIAPGNYAGQGHAWAEAVRRHCADATAMSVRVGTSSRFPTHYYVDGASFNGNLDWRLAWREHVMAHFTHVIVEANLPIMGGGTPGTAERHVLELMRAGKSVALLSHGSDARIPSVHAANERWHPYDALPSSMVQNLERQTTINAERYNRFEGAVFVSTPGMLEFVPRAVWLPVVVAPNMWQSDAEPLRGGRPIVAHVPSSAQKGSHMIDPVLVSMADRGLIEYRRVEGVPHDEMPDLYKTADLMVEQFGIADYSVAACEAMAAGRVVISRVADKVRDTVRRSTGLELPIVEANPETLESVIMDSIRHPDRAREVARQGVEFVRNVHDGRRSANVLNEWLSTTTGGHG